MQTLFYKLISQLNTENEDLYLHTLQQLTSFGDDYLDVIVAEILKRDSETNQLEQVLIFMKPPRDIVNLYKLTKNNDARLAIAVFKGLSYSGNIEVLPYLVDTFKNTWRKNLAIEAMGYLSPFEFIPFLKSEANKIIQHEAYQWIWNAQTPDNVSEYFDESDLMLLLEIIRTLRKVGINEHPKYLALLKDYYHKDAYSDWFIIRLNTIKLLGEIPVPDVINMLVPYLDDPFLEMREAVIKSLYLLGTPKALQTLMDIEVHHKIASSGVLFWYLEQWTGQSFYTLPEYQSWWTKVKHIFNKNTAYRYGEPLSIENLIQHLNGGLRTLELKLKELEIYTGLNFLPLLYRIPNVSLKNKALDLWKDKGFLFQSGGTYRFGELIDSHLW